MTVSHPTRPAPGTPYSVHDFIDDQRRILDAIKPGAGSRQCKLDRLEGRMIALRAPRLSTDPEARKAASGALKVKYGRDAAAVMERFVLVQDYLIDGCARMKYAGLGRVTETEEVCQEFLSYLLNYQLDPVQPRLPDEALDSFLDEWGHRWM
jgi:hypothetical protein